MEDIYMIKAVLFDLDGTLLDRDASVKAFIENQYQRFLPYLSHIPKENYVKRFLELDNHGYRWKDKVYQQLILEYAISDISWQALFHNFKNYCIGFPNLIATLEELKEARYTLGIITNGIGDFQDSTIQALGIKPYFATILISEREGIAKPNPDIFQKALHTLNLSPSEAVYVGDNPVNDIQAAYTIGMTGIWKQSKQHHGYSTEYSIGDLSGLPNLLLDL